MARVRKKDTIEVYRCTAAGKPATGKKATHFRFRMFLAGADEPMHWSDNVFDTKDRAMEIASWVNERMYRGEYAVVATAT